MNKKQYIEKLENLIFNKLKYHAPNLNSENIDYEVLKVVGINTNLPIFVYKKPLTKIFFKAFKKSQKRAEFNLILTKKPLINKRKIKSLKNVFIILPDEMGQSFYYSLDALNVNYPATSNYKIKYNDEFLAINDKKIEFSFSPYFLHKKYCESGVIIEIKEFLCNGKNFIISFSNIESKHQNIKIELNLPLPRGYYFFDKQKDCIEIKNLTNLEKGYFNYFCRGEKFNFANVDGLEYSSFACINFEVELKLLPKEQKKLYFNFGDKKYCFHTSIDMIEFFNLSQQKMYEIFDLKLKTSDIKFDDNFNRYLPQKIWESWQKNDHDEESENSWLKIKNSVIKKFENGEEINENFKGLKEVSMYRNQRWKRVFIIRNGARYMFADNTRYFNFFLLTKEIFKKNNEIYLSFDK